MRPVGTARSASRVDRPLDRAGVRPAVAGTGRWCRVRARGHRGRAGEPEGWRQPRDHAGDKGGSNGPPFRGQHRGGCRGDERQPAQREAREAGHAREPRGRETRREEGGLMRARPQGLGRGAAGAAPLGGRGRMATQPLPDRPAARRSLARAMGAGGPPRAILAAHSVQRSRNTLDTATSSATYHPAGTRCTGLWSGMTVLQ